MVEQVRLPQRGQGANDDFLNMEFGRRVDGRACGPQARAEDLGRGSMGVEEREPGAAVHSGGEEGSGALVPRHLCKRLGLLECQERVRPLAFPAGVALGKPLAVRPVRLKLEEVRLGLDGERLVAGSAERPPGQQAQSQPERERQDRERRSVVPPSGAKHEDRGLVLPEGPLERPQ